MVGLRYTPEALPLGLVGTAIEWMMLSAFMLAAAGQGKAQAEALGLKTPGDLVVHATWYALVWAGFREEFFYRGVLQGLTGEVLPGAWGLLVPTLLFATGHVYGSRRLSVALVWVLSTIPSGLLFAGLYEASGSLAAPVLAHGLNNAGAGLLLALAYYRPRWYRPGCLLLGGVGLAYLLWQWPFVVRLWGALWARLSTGFVAEAPAGLLLLVLTVGGIWLGHKKLAGRPQ